MADIMIDTAELAVWHQNTPGGTPDAAEDVPPDVVIDGADIEAVDMQVRAQAIQDEASFVVHHPQFSEAGGGSGPTGNYGEDYGLSFGEYDADALPVSQAAYDLRVGDRLEFRATIAHRNDTLYGSSPYGASAYSMAGDELDITWTGRVIPVDRDQPHPGRATIGTDGTDYVSAILTNRNITGPYVGEDAGFIIRDIIRRKASEITATTETVPNLGVDTDVFFQNRDCWDAIVGLAAQGDAVMRQDGRSLYVEPITSLPYAFDLTDNDYALPLSVRTDDAIHNIVRVDSGVNRKLEEENTDQTAFSTVTESTRFLHRLRARKSQVHSIELWTRKLSNDDLTVRLQADEGGQPVNVNDPDSDIEAATWKSKNVSNDNWTVFFFADHVLPDRDPWLIIEAGGPDGQEIGLDSTGGLTFRSYYPHPLNFEVMSTDSAAEYGPREIRLDKDNLETLTAARGAAMGELKRRAYPNKTVTFEAVSPRAHRLQPGDRLGVDEPSQDATGEFIVMEVDRQVGSSSNTIRLQTDISAVWRQGVLADL